MLRLWNDDCGALLATEWVFVATIFVLGAITGFVAVRQAVISELTEFANAVMALNESYSFTGQTNCQSSTMGSSASDSANFINESSIQPPTADIDQSPCD